MRENDHRTVLCFLERKYVFNDFFFGTAEKTNLKVLLQFASVKR